MMGVRDARSGQGRTVAATVGLLASLAALLLPASAAAGSRAPDLEMVSVKVAKSIAAGKRLKPKDRVRNIGDRRAGVTRVRYLLSKDRDLDEGDRLLKGGHPSPPLEAGGSHSGSGSAKVPETAEGSYYVLACADALDRIDESNEDNNCASSSKIEVEAQVSLDPHFVDFGTWSVNSQSQTIPITVTNISGSPTPKMTMHIDEGAATDFKIANDGCTGTVLEPGGTCSVGVYFAPASSGPKFAALFALNGPWPSDPIGDASLSGTAIGG